MRLVLRVTTLGLLLALIASVALSWSPAAPTVDAAGPSLEWTHQFGSPSDSDAVSAFAVDGHGNTYAAGQSGDGFFRKYSPSGTVLWNRSLGDFEYPHWPGVAVSGDGIAYLGDYTDTALPGQPSFGADDAYIRKHGSGGSVVWTRQFGTSADDYVDAVATDGAGNVYVGGRTGGTLQGGSSGGWDAYVRKYTPDGAVLWTRQFGEFGDDGVLALATDGSDNVLAIALYRDPDTPFSTTKSRLRKYGPGGARLWERNVATSCGTATDVAADAQGNIYVTAITNDRTGCYQLGSEGLLHKYGSDGADQWTRRIKYPDIGSFEGVKANSVAVDGLGNAYVTGSTWEALSGASSSGGLDAFIRKYSPTGSLKWTKQFGTRKNDAASHIAVDKPNGFAVAGATRGVLSGQSSAGGWDNFIRRYESSSSQPTDPLAVALTIKRNGAKATLTAKRDGFGAQYTVQLKDTASDGKCVKAVVTLDVKEFADKRKQIETTNCSGTRTKTKNGKIKANFGTKVTAIKLKACVVRPGLLPDSCTKNKAKVLPQLAQRGTDAERARVDELVFELSIDGFMAEKERDVHSGVDAGLDWGDDGCSVPYYRDLPAVVQKAVSRSKWSIIRSALKWPADQQIGDACLRHDFGYHNHGLSVPAALGLRPTDGMRYKIDKQLAEDITSVCLGRWKACGLFPEAANVLYLGVRMAGGPSFFGDRWPKPSTTAASSPDNQPPIADAGGPYTMEEGSTVKLDGRGSRHPDSEIVSYEWSRPARLDDPTKVRPVFSAVDDGGYVIGLFVTDDDGATTKGKSKIRVSNVDPVIEPLADLEVAVGEELALQVVFSDPGVRDTHTVRVLWGDGSASDGAVSETKGAGTATATHTYAEPGTYGLTIRAHDDDGGMTRMTGFVEVTEPGE